MNEPHAPPQSLLDAVHIHQPLQHLSGGRGLCFLAGDVVLRPADDATEAQWLGDLQLKLNNLSSPEYRIPRPLLAGDTSTALAPRQFIADGWTASSFLSGKDDPKHRWGQLFTASRAFHRDLKNLVHLPPAFIASQTHRWAHADRITWEEQTLEDTPEVNHSVLEKISGFLAELEVVKKPLSKEALVCQLIHADLTGNVLFDVDGQGLSPAIIDLSLYWRPVEFAEAVVVADGISWHGDELELI